MIIKDINKKVKNTPDNITEELAPISEEYIRGLFEGLSGDDANPIDYYTKAQTDFKIDEVKGQVATVDSKVNTSNQKITSIETNLGKVENTKYTTTNGVKEFTCTEDGYVDNVYLEGQTLVNVGEIKQKSWSAELQDCIRCRFYEGGNQNYYSIHDGTYTFYNFTNKKLTFPFLSTSSNSTWGTGIDVPANSCVVANVPNDYTCVGVDFWVRNGWQQSDMDGIGSKDVMVLKGEHSFMPYFQGVKSVGQGDNIEVLTCKTDNDLLPKNLTFTEGNYLNSITGEVGASNDFKHSNEYIPVNENEEYIFWNINRQFTIYDSNKTLIPNDWRNINQFKGNDYQSIFSYTMPNRASFIRINLPVNNIKVFSLYKSKHDKKQILTTLRSLPNGVRDKVYKIGDKYYKYETCIEKVLDGTCEVKDDSTFYNDTTVKPFIPNMLSDADVTVTNTVDFYCDKFKTKNIYNATNVDEGIYYSKTKNFHLRILKSKLETPNAEGVRKWLETNPITVVYQLETPRLIELPNFNPRTFKDGSVIIVDTGVIQAEINFEVTNSLGSRLDTATEKISAIDTSIQSMQKIHYSKVEPTNDLGKDGDLWVIYEE